MDENTRRKLREAQEREFKGLDLSGNEESVREAYRELGKHIRMAQEEMMLSKEDAIIFVATMAGTMGKNGGKE